MKPQTQNKESYSPFDGTKPGVAGNKPEEKPEVIDGRIQLPLFGGAFPAHRFCQLLYEHMAKSKKAYLRGGEVCALANGKLVQVNSALAVTWLGHFVDCLIAGKDGEERKVGLTERQTRVIIAAAERSLLPAIETVVAVPVLCDVRGQPVYAEQGYCQELLLYVTGSTELYEMPLDEAVTAIKEIIKDYTFQYRNDRSRAIAAMLTPGFKQGGFIKSHVPMSLIEANETQSGKSKLARCNAAIYGEVPQQVARRQAGVGSLDESISACLIRGQPHILIDNYRGRFDSAFLESVLTGSGQVEARAPHVSVSVDASRFFFAITSNGMSSTADFCQRVNLIRIRKRHGFKFPTFAEGDLDKHVQANWPRFLSAVYQIIIEWDKAGRPRTEENRHTFVEWASTMDWIVQNYFKLPPLMTGQEEALLRVRNPALASLREVCAALHEQGMMDQPLKASDIADAAEESGVTIGLDEGPRPQSTALQVGHMMRSAFHALSEDGHKLVLGDYRVWRKTAQVPRTGKWPGTKKGWLYAFSLQDTEPVGFSIRTECED